MTDKTNLKVCHESSTGNIITPEAIMLYAHQSFQRTDKNPDKYNISLCFPPDADLTLLKKKMVEICLEITNGDKQRTMTMVNERFHDPLNKPKNGKPEDLKFKGFTLLNLGTKDLPDFVHPNGKKCQFPDLNKECYSGRWGRVTVSPYKSKAVVGLGLGFVNVQLLRHDEPLSYVKPNAEDEFGAVEEGVAKIESAPQVKSNNTDMDKLFS